MSRVELPSGTVTFLFTDVEGSTKLLRELGEAAYADALSEHRRLLREAFARHGGVEVDTQGDAFFVAFPSAPGALAAAADAQAVLEGGPIRVRMGIHTGTPLRTDEGYVGIDIHRGARIAATGHGGQVLVSAATAALAAGNGVALEDLGEHRLKDLAASERIYQLGGGSFAPLKTLSASNLPVPGTPFVGRESELAQLIPLLRDPGVRVITVTGPGGIGKTRLALQAAAECTASFPDGLWWVALTPLADPALVLPSIGEALGVRPEEGVPLHRAIADRLEGRRTLLLLDNAEHLLPDLVDELATLIWTEGWTLLVTSRERLRLGSEHVFTVPMMSAEDAVAFFQARASMLGISVEPSDTLATLCEHLDRLPLALQLAAARLRLFSLEQVLDRLSRRLEILKGERDAEPHQQTIRATIEWSHDLLSEEEQLLFRRLAVFVGGSTLEAAEEICDADGDVLQALFDKSLVQRRDDAPEPRFWMLESIRDFALERLESSGEAADLRARHASWFRVLGDEAGASMRAGDPEEVHVAVLDADVSNLRAAVSFALETGDAELVRSITADLRTYWIMRGGFAEGRSWIERALELGAGEDVVRLRLLRALAIIAYNQGDHGTAIAASDEAAKLAMALGGAVERYELLTSQADAAELNGDLERAEALYEEAFRAARDADNGVGMSSCRLALAYFANLTARHERAEAILQENLGFARSRGQTRCEAHTLANLGETSVYVDRPADAADRAAAGARRALQIGEERLATHCLDVLAYAAAARGGAARAATMLGASDGARDRMGVVLDEADKGIVNRTVDRVREALDDDAVEAAWSRGRGLDLEAALELATRNS